MATLFCHLTMLPLLFLFVFLSYQTNTVVSIKWCSIHLCSSSFIAVLGHMPGLRLIVSIWLCILQTVVVIFKYTTGGVGCVTY